MHLKRFRLREVTLSVYSSGSSKGHVYVPAGAVIVITSSGRPLVNVLWENQKLKMFAADIHDRADLVLDV